MDKRFSYPQSHLLISVAISHSIIVLVRTFLFIPPSWSVPAVFSSSCWGVLSFSFRSSTCFTLISCRLEDLDLSVSWFFVIIQQFSHHQKLGRRALSSVYALSTFVGNSMTVAGWAGCWVLCYFCWSMSIFVCVTLVLLLGVCSVCSLISGTVISASVLFMPTIIYYQGLLQRFYANCRIPHTHTSSVKIARRIVLLIASKF